MVDRGGATHLMGDRGGAAHCNGRSRRGGLLSHQYIYAQDPQGLLRKGGMRHDVSLTMFFQTLWCRLYQTSVQVSPGASPSPCAVGRRGPRAGVRRRSELQLGSSSRAVVFVRYIGYAILLRNGNASQ